MTHLTDLLLMTLCTMCASWMLTVLNGVLAVGRKLLLDERVYSETQNRASLTIVMHRIRASHVYAERHEIFDGSMFPCGMVVGSSFAAMTKTTVNGSFAPKEALTVRVLRWRWLPPLVADSDATGARSGADEPKGTISVMRPDSQSVSSRSWRLTREIACPAGVGAIERMNANAAADLIVSDARANGGQARVIVCGAPGTGKSTAVRLVALALDATLVPVFDPSRLGFSTGDVFASVQRGSRIVIAMEEFDGVLMRLDRLSNDTSAQGITAEVKDKASWNNMLDMLQFMPNVVLVMTSNLSFAELDAIDAVHGLSLLRTGRITKRIAVEDANEPDKGSVAKKRKKKTGVRKEIL